MYKDFGRLTININRYSLYNFGLGFDYYHEEYWHEPVQMVKVLQLSLLFFNVTITLWDKGEQPWR
jgi:hypothetical protein